MPRIRYLKPDFFKDEDLALYPFETRLCYQGLWVLADKAGRLEDRPPRLKAEIFPYDNVDIEVCLQHLSECKNGSGKPFIHRYSTDEQRFIQIINWHKHQKPHHTEKESIIPEPPEFPLFEKKQKSKLKGNGKGNGEFKPAQSECDVKERFNNGGLTVIYTLEQCKDACIMNGIPEINAESYYNQYASQGWKKGNGQVITNLQAHMAKRWNRGKNCWDFDEGKGKQQKTENEGKTRLWPISGRSCGERNCKMPAVYKHAGAFDNYYCAEHMPAKVKEKFYA